MDYPPIDNDFSWGIDRLCKDVKISRPAEHFGLSFGSSKSFTFIQDVAKDDHFSGRDVRVHGNVILRRVGNGTPSPSVVLEVIVNDDRISADVKWDGDFQELLVTVPRKLSWDETSTSPCMMIRATVWVPEDGVLQDLNLEAIHLGIYLLDNLSMAVNRNSKIKSVVGSVAAAIDGTASNSDSLIDHAPESFRFDSRVIEVSTVSATIRGNWPLLDYLSLQSISGSIKTGITPKPAAEDSPKPAILYLKTLSGSVHVQEPVHKAQQSFLLTEVESQGQVIDQSFERAEKYIPPRDYRIDIQTTSGSVSGILAFSSSCTVHSTSGGHSLELLPVLDSSLAEDDSRASKLETSTNSGSAHLKILDPIWVDGQNGDYIFLPAPPSPPAPSSAPSPPDAPIHVIPIGDIGADDPYASLPGRTYEAEAGAVVSQLEKQTLGTARAWRSINSRHSTTSASVKINYPSTWEGDIDLNSISGSLKTGGKDVEIIKVGGDWPGYNKHLLARKGPEGGSKVYVKTTSGSVNVRVGDQ